MRFVDEVEIVVASGNGGAGCIAFRREKYVHRGGPAGGDGGRGGTLVVRATRARNTLIDFRRNKAYRAPNGRPGEGSQKTGASGDELVLDVPVGTMIFDADTDELLADLDHEDAAWALYGGLGGLGNIHFKTGSNRTPEFAQDGQPGDERRVRLELKLIADVGLLGFPNAGKSTLISRLSHARPRVADYPFTTLVPQLGVVRLADGQSFVIADIPGLVEGAAEGRGLGHQFLRHVERCPVYLHLVSPEDVEGDPVDRLRAIEAELEAYSPELATRPRVVVLTKADLLDQDARRALALRLAEASGQPVYVISSVTGEGVEKLVGDVWQRLIRADDDGEEGSAVD